MRVVAHVLRRIDDEKPITQQIAGSPALAELVKNYNTLAILARTAEDESLALVTGDTSGHDFKRSMSLLPSKDAHHMLDQYLSHFPHYDKGSLSKERGVVSDDNDEDEDEHDSHDHGSSSSAVSRRDKMWFIKVAIIFALAVFMIIFGAMVAIITHNHGGDNAVFKSIMVTATELLKIIFSNK